MMVLRRHAFMSLCCLLLAGCHRKQAVVALQPPAPPPVMISVPPPTHRLEPLTQIPVEDVPRPDLQLPRVSSHRFRPLRMTRGQLAALNPPPSPVELGQLTTGGEAGNASLRQQTEDLLRSQQRRLAALPLQLVARHSQQVQQVKLFLRQADEAWKSLDLDGTKTLATKAKVLLDELQT